MADFHVADHVMRYSQFVPRLYNLCKSLGFDAGRIMPSRAFCSTDCCGKGECRAETEAGNY